MSRKLRVQRRRMQAQVDEAGAGGLRRRHHVVGQRGGERGGEVARIAPGGLGGDEGGVGGRVAMRRLARQRHLHPRRDVIRQVGHRVAQGGEHALAQERKNIICHICNLLCQPRTERSVSRTYSSRAKRSVMPAM